MAEMFAVLPHCIGSEAVDEKKIGFDLVEFFGNPSVHDGAISEVYGNRTKAGVGKYVTVELVEGGGKAEAF